MKLALIFDKQREDTIGVYFERACRALGLAYTHAWTSQAAALAPGYDLYLRVDHGDYRHDLPDGLRPAVFLATDTHLPKSWRRIRRAAPRYDLVCCVHRRGADALPNGAWVPAACDPAVHGKLALPKMRDVAFVGTEGGIPRKFYLQALRERYPNSFISHAPYTEIGRIYSQAKIGFNCSVRDDVNMRMFEILASGTLLVTNRLSHDELEQLGLRDGEHLVCYDTPAQLFEVIDRYLRDDGTREAIARRGMERVLQHHTYEHRLQQILKLAGFAGDAEPRLLPPAPPQPLAPLLRSGRSPASEATTTSAPGLGAIGQVVAAQRNSLPAR